VWQTSDVTENHPGIQEWLADEQLANALPPLTLDVTQADWPPRIFDGVFSANTVHIMHWPAVEKMFAGIGRVLLPGGRFCLYGPFNIDGRHTAPSNARFDLWLKQRDPGMGVRDMGDLDRLAAAAGLTRSGKHAMPADNFILVWERTSR
jgi:SAM-dependent methyltransferase